MISVIVPIYNEEQLIEELCRRLFKAMQSLNLSFEVLMVEDGSSDDSLNRLLAIQKGQPALKVVQLSRNYGHQAAFTAGLTLASGKYLVLMDGDLQDPPELIQNMLNKLRDESLDIVFAKRENIQESWFRKFLMKRFHRIFHRIIRDPDARDVGNFSVFTDQVQQAMLRYTEKVRYLPGIRFHVGFKQGHVLFTRDARAAGKPKMNLSKLIALALDAIFSFSNIPIRFILVLGLLGMALSMFGLVYSIVSKLLGIAPLGWSSTMVFISLLGSIQVTFLGIIGEYVYRTYQEVQNRPLFIIKNITQP